MDNRHNYMLIDRLRSDCEYFLNWGNGNLKRLYYGNIKDHIAGMKKLWNDFKEKPQWLSLEQIEQYEKDMLEYKH